MLKVSISLGSANSSQKIIISFFIFSSTYWIVISAKVLLKATLFLSHPMQAYHKGLLGAFVFYKDLSGDSLRSSQASIRAAAPLWSHAYLKKYGIYLESIWNISHKMVDISGKTVCKRALVRHYWGCCQVSPPVWSFARMIVYFFFIPPTNHPTNHPTKHVFLFHYLHPPFS